MLVAHDALVGGLSTAERDTFVREWDAVARLMGLPSAQCWPDVAALRRYVDDEVLRGQAQPGAGSLEVAQTVLHPPVKSPLLRPGTDTLAFIATGLLPSRLAPRLRADLDTCPLGRFRGIDALDAARNPASLSRRLRISPVYDVALARSERRWPGSRAA